MNREVVVDIVERLPQAAISRAWGWIARRRHPKVGVDILKRVFVAATGIDLTEAREEIGDYDCLEDLFVRRLRPGTRRVEPDATAVVSPVDALVGACGVVEKDTLFQVKGRSYFLSRLLDDPENAKRFEGGPYATFYLSPRDYHRIHAPVSGVVREARVVPGGLLPVFPEALQKVDELFARNERLITYIDTTHAGRVAVVKVGATLVGRISLAYDPDVYTNEKGQARRTIHYDPPHLIQKGADLGAFELGSTVVLVGEKGRIDFNGVMEGSATRMGLRIGSVVERLSKRAPKKLVTPPKYKVEAEEGESEPTPVLQSSAQKISKKKSAKKKTTKKKSTKKKSTKKKPTKKSSDEAPLKKTTSRKTKATRKEK
uniref:phosphatidylserine decarboxylase n=1 Tax=uncultured myxobacterium HF0200_19H16 TaxID=723559 RepID=E7C3X4_9BACT|nr:phosphatidylserine decarboxylase [uncultured myxobacterium HF0200_19H16]